jgi:hypothetical protein
MRFFETIGSAIVIAYDDRPVLTTDAWIDGDAYFGSWGLDYEWSACHKPERPPPNLKSPSVFGKWRSAFKRFICFSCMAGVERTC